MTVSIVRGTIRAQVAAIWLAEANVNKGKALNLVQLCEIVSGELQRRPAGRRRPCALRRRHGGRRRRAPASGVISYPAAFFAPNQPTTALDIVNLIPGFTFDKGAGVRGYRGGAPNVLIDGARLASKDDTVEAVLRRIPADQIARVDLIRGGAPGIDMQGKTLVANLVRRSKPGAAATITASIVPGRPGQCRGHGARRMAMA